MTHDTTTFTIDAGTFARTALAVQAEGRMGYQVAANRATGRCRYSYPDGCRCAVGAGLPVEAAIQLDRDHKELTVLGLLNLGVLRITSAVLDGYTLEGRLIKIQSLHDGAMFGSTAPEDVAERGAEITRLLTELAELHPAGKG